MRGRRRLYVSEAAGLLASAHMDHDVVVWSLESETVAARLVGHWGDLCAGAFDAPGTRLATAGAEGTLRVWDLASQSQAHELDVGDRVVRDVRFDGDGLRLVVDDGRIVRWVPGEGVVVEGRVSDATAAFFVGAKVWIAAREGLRRWPDESGLPWTGDVGPMAADDDGVLRLDHTRLRYDGHGAHWGQPIAGGRATALDPTTAFVATDFEVKKLNRSTGGPRGHISLSMVVDDLVFARGRLWGRDTSGRVGDVAEDRWLTAPLLTGWAGGTRARVHRDRLDEDVTAPPEPIRFETVAIEAPEPEALPATPRDVGTREHIDRAAAHLRIGGRGYREMGRVVTVHGSGLELELHEAERVARLRVLEKGRLGRVEIVATRGDAIRPPVVRLARWLRRRSADVGDEGLVSTIRAHPGVRDVRFARAGRSISVTVQVAPLPEGPTLAAWVDGALASI